MQKTNSQAKNMRRQMQSSTTLSRRYVRRPQGGISIKVNCVTNRNNQTNMHGDICMHNQANSNTNTQMNVGKNSGMSTNERSNTMSQDSGVQLTARELKDQAIKKALANAAATTSSEKTKKTKKNNKLSFGFSKVLLAISCATAAVAAIAYLANVNMPDVSLQVAALQTGIDASYPNYIPRDFNTSSITSEDGKIVLEFSNSNTDSAFKLTEETSSWDSNALETNYVKEEFGENYTIIREQGLTIYISGSNAAWVNGGVVFKLETTSGSLTNKQIKSIAVSAR